MSFPYVSQSNGNAGPPQPPYYSPPAVHYHSSPVPQSPYQAFPQSPSTVDTSSGSQGFPFPIIPAQSTSSLPFGSFGQLPLQVPSQHHATMIDPGFPPGSQPIPSPIVPPEPPLQNFGGAGQQMPFPGAPSPAANFPQYANPGAIPAPSPPAAQLQEPPIFDQFLQLTQAAQQQLPTQPRHYDQHHLQSNIQCLQHIHDWLNTANPVVHDVRVILNQVEHLAAEINFSIISLFKIGVFVYIAARSAKAFIQGIYQRAGQLLQRQHQDQTPAPAQEQAPYADPTVPIPAQEQTQYTSPPVSTPATPFLSMPSPQLDGVGTPYFTPLGSPSQIRNDFNWNQ